MSVEFVASMCILAGLPAILVIVGLIATKSGRRNLAGPLLAATMLWGLGTFALLTFLGDPAVGAVGALSGLVAVVLVGGGLDVRRSVGSGTSSHRYDLRRLKENGRVFEYYAISTGLILLLLGLAAGWVYYWLFQRVLLPSG